MDEFCWKKERFDIDVTDKNIQDIEFLQTGYSMPYTSTHDFDIKVKKGSGGKSEKKKIAQS